MDVFKTMRSYKKTVNYTNYSAVFWFFIPQFCIRNKFYDGERKEFECFALGFASGMYAVNVPIGQWHNLEVIEPAVIFEAKDGAYEPFSEEDVI